MTRSLYENRTETLAAIKQLQSAGLSYKGIANRLRTQGYTNTKGNFVKAQDISNFLYLNRPLVAAAKPRHARKVSTVPWTADVRAVVKSNLSPEMKLKFVSQLVG
jgi:hypothetical protein